MRRRRHALFALIAAASAAGCAGPDGLRAEGVVAGERVETRVDSDLARYYLETYLAGRRERPEWDARIDAIERRYPTDLPSREALAEIARTFSPDFATLFLVRRIERDPASRVLRAAFGRALARIAAGERAAVPRGADYELLFAPGWFYRLHPENGGDFAHVREALAREGVRATLLATDENGSVEANARAIAEAIRARPEGSPPVVLVSASKSGPEVALALGELLAPEETVAVRAWFNIGGVLRGSPLADRALEAPLRWFVGPILWWNGFDCAGLASLATEARRARFAALRFPPDLLVVNYLPAPLLGDVTDRGRDGFEDLRPHGPNDGLTLLVDQIVPGSLTIVQPGADHFLRLPDIRDRTLALLGAVLGELDRRAAASRARTRNPSLRRRATAEGVSRAVPGCSRRQWSQCCGFLRTLGDGHATGIPR